MTPRGSRPVGLTGSVLVTFAWTWRGEAAVPMPDGNGATDSARACATRRSR